jgi:hypothetical protein
LRGVLLLIQDRWVRMFVGSLVTALALAGAVYLHSGVKFGSRQVSSPNPYGGLLSGQATLTRIDAKASWQDPLAIFIAVAGVGAGAGIVLRR